MHFAELGDIGEMEDLLCLMNCFVLVQNELGASRP